MHYSGDIEGVCFRGGLKDLFEAARMGEKNTSLGLYVIALLPALLILMAVGVQSTVPIADLTRDPMMVARKYGDGRTYFGALSNLGIVIWTLTVGSGILGSAVMAAHARFRPALFLLTGAALSAVLMLDDLYMLHERILGAHLGIGEIAVIVAYAGLVALYLVVFRFDIARSGPGLFLVALALFAGSILVDLADLEEIYGDFGHLIEDGAKFLGIVTWTVFHFRAAYLALMTHIPALHGKYR